MTTGAVKSCSQIITTNKPTPNILQTGCPSCRPTNSVKALCLTRTGEIRLVCVRVSVYASTTHSSSVCSSVSRVNSVTGSNKLSGSPMIPNLATAHSLERHLIDHTPLPATITTFYCLLLFTIRDGVCPLFMRILTG